MTVKDIISRDTLKRLTADLARDLLGVDGEVIEVLETQNQRVEDRRADLVARMRAASGEEFLLHTEIANNNQSAGDPVRKSGPEGPSRGGSKNAYTGRYQKAALLLHRI